ncbi:unnamed protein product, partial [Discosporangium mesarthrocarpum]
VAFELYDVDGTGKIKADEMEALLCSINETASYFGDPVMKREEVKTLVDDIFLKHSADTGGGYLDYNNFLLAVVEHPVIVQFVAGEGTMRYGSGM